MAPSTWRLLYSNNIFPLAFVAFLSTSSYLLGIYLHARGAAPRGGTLLSTCHHTPLPSSPPLDFSLHHPADALLLLSTSTPTFPFCPPSLTDLTPCHDPKRALTFRRFKLAHRDRHCGTIDKCLVPAPDGYRIPFPWPESRDVVWLANVPHKHLAVDKAGQNWVRVDGDRFRFPGGGTMFPGGADKYIQEIAEVVPLSGGAVRTAVDTGCGVASFGAYLMSRNVTTVSFAPRDSHEAQVQFALERGVPALIGVIATDRLPYPARAFDLAHCSRCLIPWHLYDGQYLAEIDRILRPGGYWVLSGPPINWETHWKGWERKPEDLKVEQTAIEGITESLCWKKLKQKGDIAVWQKPFDHMKCKESKKANPTMPFCSEHDPDKAWYTKLGTCITPIPEEVSGKKLKKWPERIMAVPPRISTGSVSGINPTKFQEDSKLWKKRVDYYKSKIGELGKKGRYRNLLDMNSGLGGFAASLTDDPVWVMNVMPTATVDTLGVVYERGLIGTYQDWCESMSTYPRTYDFIHSNAVFSLYKGRCDWEYILLEMDRILRPEGSVIFRDDVDILVKIKSLAQGMRWDAQFVDHEDGPLEREKILIAVKKHWNLPKPTQT